MNTGIPDHPSSARIVLLTAGILLVPLLAMQFSTEVVWTFSDFVAMGALLLGAGFAYRLAARTSGSTTYRLAFGITIACAFLLVWINLAVGIIGSEDEPANAMYFGVLGVGLVGSLLARLRPAGMARTLWAMALAHALVGTIAIAGGLGGEAAGPMELLGLTALFVAPFAAAATLFGEAARERAERGAA